MKIIKRIDNTRKYKDKNGKERVSTTYLIVLDNNYSIIFKPYYSNDYRVLDGVAEVVFHTEDK